MRVEVRGPQPRRVLEEYAYILDFLPQGYPDDPRPLYQREPIIQAIGETYFTLLELVPKRNVEVSLHERVYIGKGYREKIERVRRRLSYDELTSVAKSELPYVLEKIVEMREKEFVDFFNNAQPVTTRMHQLELLPGIGKKTMWEILEERKRKPFESFEDISSRIRMPDPKKVIVKRIIMELKGEDKYQLFVKAPIKQSQRQESGYEGQKPAIRGKGITKTL